MLKMLLLLKGYKKSVVRRLHSFWEAVWVYLSSSPSASVFHRLNFGRLPQFAQKCQFGTRYTEHCFLASSLTRGNRLDMSGSLFSFLDPVQPTFSRIQFTDFPLLTRRCSACLIAYVVISWQGFLDFTLARAVVSFQQELATIELFTWDEDFQYSRNKYSDHY